MSPHDFDEITLGKVENIIELYEPIHEILVDSDKNKIDTGYITMALSSAEEDYSGHDEALRTRVNRVLGVMDSQNFLELEEDSISVDSSSWSASADPESYNSDDSEVFFQNLEDIYKSKIKDNDPVIPVELEKARNKRRYTF